MTTRPNRRLFRLLFALRYRLAVIGRRIRRGRHAEPGPRIAVVYAYPAFDSPGREADSLRFATTYAQFPALADHSLHVWLELGIPSGEASKVFAGLPCEFHRYDTRGLDVRAFQEAARRTDCGMIVCLGASTYFRRAGWLERMLGAFVGHGDGLYGASGSYEGDPHIRATGFWCNRGLLAAYPRSARSRADSDAFEVGSASMTRLAEHLGLGCWVVTWDAVYDKPTWRTGLNVFHRGDQGSSLVYDRQFDLFDAMGEEARRILERRDSVPLLGSGWYTNETLKNPMYEIGDYTYGHPEVLSYGEGARLRIGKFCSIASQVRIFLGGNHRTDWTTTYPFAAFIGDWPEAAGIAGAPTSKGDVVVGNDVWIGHGATILSGVRIGDGAAIGAMAVVTKDVPDYAVVAGNPARVVRMRFDDATIGRLIQLKWWDWPAEQVRANLPVLCSDRVDEFTARGLDG